MKAAELQPAVVVMDIGMSKMDGITATRLIKAKYPHIPVVGLSIYVKDYMEYAMRKSGAFEVLTKDSAAVKLFGAIQRAVAAIQPVVILEETPGSDVERSNKPVPTEPALNEPKI